jgi:hypothetical protein
MQVWPVAQSASALQLLVSPPSRTLPDFEDAGGAVVQATAAVNNGTMKSARMFMEVTPPQSPCAGEF